jgi:hypothetical protein
MPNISLGKGNKSALNPGRFWLIIRLARKLLQHLRHICHSQQVIDYDTLRLQ